MFTKVATVVRAVVTVGNLCNRRISWELVAENGLLEVANFSNALAKVTTSSIFPFFPFSLRFSSLDLLF